MTDEDFLAELQNVRNAYGDWLEEQGQLEKARWVRGGMHEPAVYLDPESIVSITTIRTDSRNNAASVGSRTMNSRQLPTSFCWTPTMSGKCSTVGVTAFSKSAWHLRSWDRFMIPKPFARVVISYGPMSAVSATDVRDAVH